MVVYTRLDINSVTYDDALQIDVERSIGDYNAISFFTVEFDNGNGQYDDTFSLNEDVQVYGDVDTNPATTKIFRGIIEDISFLGRQQDEKVVLSGRDYGAVLQDVTIQPVVYKDRDAGEIAKIVIEQNVSDIVTTNNVDVTTGTTIEKIGFNQKNVFDALKKLAELSGYYFYVDTDKDVHFIVKSGIASGLTFDNTNIISSKFRTNDGSIFNKVWVYGDRILTGATDIGGIGAGSIMTLTDKPHNTRVSVGGTLQEVGGVLNLDDPLTESGLKYVVNFNERQVIFVSGVAAGDNIPDSGASNVNVDYERSTPILKYKEDSNSITSYGPKSKVITDRNIKDFSEADAIATEYLANNKDPTIQGDIEVNGVVDVTPGNTCVVNIPFHNVSNQTYTILNASYSFNKINNRGDNVLSLTINKKIFDFTDTLKEQMLKIRAFETGPLEGTLSYLQLSNGSIGIKQHYEVWARDIGSAFIFELPGHNQLNSSSSLLGDVRAGSALNTSGGDF